MYMRVHIDFILGDAPLHEFSFSPLYRVELGLSNFFASILCGCIKFHKQRPDIDLV
jgi:hypothetical protein